MRKAFICPSKYVQGENEIENLGYFVKQYGGTALLIADSFAKKLVSSKLDSTREKFGVAFINVEFCGECSREEVVRLQNIAKENKCDCIIGLGGGKAIDTAKCVNGGKSRLIIVPTIAATDAPTSHSAVLYTPSGDFDNYAYFTSPDVVLIDLTVIANAPTRFLVSGMGDALSTYFEARANSKWHRPVNAGLPCGALHGDCAPARGTKTAMALAELCYKTLIAEGYKAKTACDANMVTASLEDIVETNILLSGLGFESAGLGAAHAIHDGFTIIEEAHHYTHGEKVAFGTICQLVLENAPQEEIDEVLSFCDMLGLPMCLADLGIKDISDRLMDVARKACIPEESIHNMPFPITPEGVAAAIMVADKMGSEFKNCCCEG